MPQTLHERVYHTSSGNVFYWIDASADKGAPCLYFFLVSLPTTPCSTRRWRISQVRQTAWYGMLLHMGSRAHIRLTSPWTIAPVFCTQFWRLRASKTSWLVGQSVGGYVAQAFIDLYPREAAGFVAIDSAPLKRKYYPTWEVKALRHTKGMYQFVPWSWLKALGSWGRGNNRPGEGRHAFLHRELHQRGVCGARRARLQDARRCC